MRGMTFALARALLAVGVLMFFAAGATRAQGGVAPVAEKWPGEGRFVIVAPFPPGGPVDTLARILVEGLQRRHGVAAIVENLAGGAGNIGMDKVRRAKADGHTLLVVPAGNLTINPSLMPNFPFAVDKDFAPVALLAKAPNVLVASVASGIQTPQMLIEQARAKPEGLAYASPGVGSGLHLAGELFKQQASVPLTHVPYKGTGPALNDTLGGVVPLMFSNLPATLSHIRAGRLVALGVTDTARSAVAPDIPTLAEQGVPGVVVSSWYGLLATGGTPRAIVEQLARDAADILSQPAVRETLKAQGLSEGTLSPAEFAELIRRETQTWARIIKARQIKAE